MRARSIGVSLGLAALAGTGLLLADGERRAKAWAGARAWISGESADSTEQFWCPMDPQIVRLGQGMCPICNMELVLYEGGGSGGEPGVLRLTDRQVQQAGVRLGSAEVRDLAREIHTTGLLLVDPARRRTLSLELPGTSRVQRLLAQSAGFVVEEGQVLIELTNESMSSDMADYRVVLKELGELRRRGDLEALQPRLGELQALRKKLDRPGVPYHHIDNLASNPRYQFSELVFPIVSPIDGVLLDDPQFEQGLFLKQGAPLFRIADLSELWLQVDLYEDERALVTPGCVVEFHTYSVPDKVFRAPIDFIEPVVQERTQTTRARCQVLNTSGELAPGMVVRADIRSAVPQVLAVPESAVLQSGLRDVVLVSEGSGHFRPKIVQLGRRHLSLAGDGEEQPGLRPSAERFHEIRSGLQAGDRVVVAGNFLLNAEAQFQGILDKMSAAADLQQEAAQIPDDLRDELEAILDAYFDASRALVADDAEALAALGPALKTPGSAMVRADGLRPLFVRLAQAAVALGEGVEREDDLEEQRKLFGSLSREVVAYLRDCAPARVAGGELFVFRCPMADPYGFELWIQDEDDLANPYMGRSMPECGMPAELR
jgi:Cu(I)/Ag(I) efflux system membrane fusion protein